MKVKKSVTNSGSWSIWILKSVTYVLPISNRNKVGSLKLINPSNYICALFSYNYVMTLVTCKQCEKKFNAKPSRVKASIDIYCSRICKVASSKKGKTVKCSTCDKVVYKSLKALNGSKSGKLFCSRSCQTKWRNVEFSQEKHANWKGGAYAYRSLLSRQDLPKECKLCKTADKRILAVHHIDKNHSNNAIENLVWLCHNCHHLVHHDKNEYKRFMAAMV